MAWKPEEAVRGAVNLQSDATALPETHSQSGPASIPDTGISDPGAATCKAGNNVTIVVCSTCRRPDGADVRPTPGELLAEAVRAALAAGDTITQGNIKIVSIECLGNCKRRLSAALVTSGCWTYVFGDLGVDNAADLLKGAELMRDTTNGLMPWRDRPQCLKSGMVSRVPPITVPPSVAAAKATLLLKATK